MSYVKDKGNDDKVYVNVSKLNVDANNNIQVNRNIAKGLRVALIA